MQVLRRGNFVLRSSLERACHPKLLFRPPNSPVKGPKKCQNQAGLKIRGSQRFGSFSFFAPPSFVDLSWRLGLDLAIVIAPLAGWLAWSFLNWVSITTHKITIVLLSIVFGIVPASIFLLHNFLTFGNIIPLISWFLKLAISAREGGVRAVNGIVIAYVLSYIHCGNYLSYQ